MITRGDSQPETKKKKQDLRANQPTLLLYDDHYTYKSSKPVYY